MIKEKYPEVEVYSYKEIADDINSAYDFKIDYWGSKTLKENGAKKKFNIKKQTDKVIQLEGKELVILGPMGGRLHRNFTSMDTIHKYAHCLGRCFF